MRLWKKLRKASMLIMPLFMASFPAWAGVPPDPSDGTMLMFVGEELYVVTVASKRPESPQEAPAIVSVVGRREIEEKGYRTMTDLLSMQPGFFMAEKTGGTTPYLRGIRDGAMMLYDGVPVAMDLPQNPHPMDGELSLSGVKRVEIVRGPGSVLWGPDAYAGIVNVVPLTGRDSPGLVTKPFSGSHDLRGLYTSWGDYGKNWDLFVSANGAKEHAYSEDPFIEGAVGKPASGTPVAGSIDDSEYLELTANAHLGEWLTVSGRFSDFKRRFTSTMSDGLTFGSERSTPVSYLKATAAKEFGLTRLSMTGYYLNIRYDETDAGLTRDHENDVFYGELLCERPLFETGSLTLGASFREGRVGGNYAESSKIYLFLDKDNDVFVPTTLEDDYTARLRSVFTQFRHRWAGADWWAGIRYDDHSRYDENSISYSFGMNKPLSSQWRIKTGLGTAYRSPYSSAAGKRVDDPLLAGIEQSIDPEAISTLNFQVAWNPTPGKEIALTLFYSHLSDRIIEDSFGVLSFPMNQDISGIELSGRFRIFDNVELTANLTATHSGGSDVRFRNLDYTIINPVSGNIVEVYSDWEEPFDSGPDFMAGLGLVWRPSRRLGFSVDAMMSGSHQYSFERGFVTGSFDRDPIINLSMNLKKFLMKNSRLTLRGTNLFDSDYSLSGQYGPVDGRPLTLYAEWEIRF